MQVVKEKMVNLVASANSGMEKGKAIVDETVERMSANDEMEKQMATQRKQERIDEAERKKQEIYKQNVPRIRIPPRGRIRCRACLDTVHLRDRTSLKVWRYLTPLGLLQGLKLLIITHVLPGDTNKGHSTGGACTG